MLLRSSSTPILGSAISSQADVAKESDVTHISHVVCHPPSPSCHSPVPLPRSNSFSNSSLHTSLVDSPRKATREHEGDPASQSWLRRAQSEGDIASVSGGSARVCAASSLMSSVVDESDSASENTSTRYQWAKRISSQSRGSAKYKQDSIIEESEALEFGSENDQGITECSDENSALTERHRAFESSDVRNNSFSELRSLTPESVLILKAGREFFLDDGEIYTSLSVDANGSPVACNSRGCRPLTKLESEKLGFLSMHSGLGTGTGGGYHGGNTWNSDGGGGCPGSNGTDAHYKSLLQADPQNPLLLRNYAQYLNEVEGDCKRSEECLERAILACPGDGEVLAQYAKLQWDVHRDQERAETYYGQAVQAAPDDCYVLASYASFLWDAEDNEDIIPSSSSLHPALHGASSSSTPLMASA